MQTQTGGYLLPTRMYLLKYSMARMPIFMIVVVTIIMLSQAFNNLLALSTLLYFCR
jgi:hypothetical protein